MNSTKTRPTEPPRAGRRMTVLTSGTRARQGLTVSGQVHAAQEAPLDRSFSYTNY